MIMEITEEQMIRAVELSWQTIAEDSLQLGPMSARDRARTAADYVYTYGGANKEQVAKAIMALDLKTFDKIMKKARLM